jgi:hypothetical protein
MRFVVSSRSGTPRQTARFPSGSSCSIEVPVSDVVLTIRVRVRFAYTFRFGFVDFVVVFVVLCLLCCRRRRDDIAFVDAHYRSAISPPPFFVPMFKRDRFRLVDRRRQV